MEDKFITIELAKEPSFSCGEYNWTTVGSTQSVDIKHTHGIINILINNKKLVIK